MSYQFDNLFDFTGGQNSTSAPDRLLDNEMRIAKNVDLSVRGGFSRRSGIVEYKNIGESKIDRLIPFEYIDSEGVAHNQLLALSDGKLVNTEDSTELTTALDTHLDYEVYKNKLYILSTGRYMVYDGTQLIDVTCEETDYELDEIKKCKYIEQRGERIFISGHPTNKNFLFYSQVGRPEYFKDTSYIVNAVTDDGDYVTGLKEFHGALLVFKSRSIFAWTGYDPELDVEFKRLAVHTGTKAYRTIQYVGNYLLFLGQDGVYALNGTYENVIMTTKLSANIDADIKNILHKSEYHLNPHCAVYHKNKYMLSVPTNDENICDKVLVLFGDLLLDGKSKSWVTYTGWNINDFLVGTDSTLLSASGVSGIVQKHENSIYNDLGQPIEIEVELKQLSQKAPIHNKKYRRGYVAFRQFEDTRSSVDIKTKVDYTENIIKVTPDESLVWDDRDWDTYKWDFIDLVTRRFNIKQKGKRLTVSFYDNTVDQRLTVYGIGIEYKIKKPDRD